MNNQLLNALKTPQAFNRKATGNNDALGPLDTLILGNSWVGDTGYNLMVVPSPLGINGFLVMISQLFETQTFDAVPAPVPNRSLANGTAQMGAVKYSQKVAENVSKNILHEETGMWMNQTLGTAGVSTPPNGLEAIHGTLDGQPASSYILTNPIIRSGTVPHGNTFQAAGVCKSYAFQQPGLSGDVSPYIEAGNFPTANGVLSFLPTFVDGSDPTQLQADYRMGIHNALNLLGLPSDVGSIEQFVNPIALLNKYANKIVSIDALSITTANDLGMVLNVPFERAVAGPQDFICTFMIETVQNANTIAPSTDQLSEFFQIQYLQSIPLLFPKGYMGKDVLFPHWNVNTLIAI
jgi:hypothetical protein